ncbi:MAG: response regulator, partial [Bacteroidales bacterium]|nr:response regulator [Bacteroidales bacterium]
NLLSNAYKFTLRGEVNITLQKKTERRILFTVEDTGIGMTREELKTVFQRFKRSKTSEEKKIGGTGLGLAISKNLVELLGGEMWVSSEKDKGTKFCFELPFVKVPKPIPKPIDEGIHSFFNNDWSDYSILVVEDSEDNRKFINQVLKQTQINTINAANGKEAIEAMNFEKSIDVILMDLQMPVLNGFDASKVIKRHYPNIPIIALSALAMESDKERALSHGCDDYLAKPIQIEKLLGKIAQYIHKRKMLGTASKKNQTNDNKSKNNSEKNISIQTSKQ